MVASIESDLTTQAEPAQQAKKSAVTALGLDPAWTEAEQRGYQLVKVISEGGYGLVVQAKHSISGKDVAIKYMENFYGHKYTLVKVLRELSIMQYLQEAQEQNGVPTLFSGAIDAFAPKEDLKNEKIRRLFIVMELKRNSLEDIL